MTQVFVDVGPERLDMRLFGSKEFNIMSITDRALRMIMVANIFSNTGDTVQAEEVPDAGCPVGVRSTVLSKGTVCGNPVAK